MIPKIDAPTMQVLFVCLFVSFVGLFVCLFVCLLACLLVRPFVRVLFCLGLFFFYLFCYFVSFVCLFVCFALSICLFVVSFFLSLGFCFLLCFFFLGGGGGCLFFDGGERGQSARVSSLTKRRSRETLNRLTAYLVQWLSRPPPPGIDSCFRRGSSSRSSPTRVLTLGTPLAALPGAWRFWVGAGTGCPVSVNCDRVR